MARRARGQQRRDRLARVAAPLEPRVAPYYVAADQLGTDGRYRAPGWYWVPADAGDAPEYLAFDSVLAEHQLRKLRETQWAEENEGSPA